MSDNNVDVASDRIVGRPTLLVVYGARLDGRGVLRSLDAIGYPTADVRVYYRVAGTDQVIDAVTGDVPAGESLTPGSVGRAEAEKLETLVLMHPDASQFPAVKQALDALGSADFMYSEATVAEGHR